MIYGLGAQHRWPALCSRVLLSACVYMCVSKDECAHIVSMCAMECNSVHCLGECKIREFILPSTAFHYLTMNGLDSHWIIIIQKALLIKKHMINLLLTEVVVF